jgi:DNA-binding NtrC family response regulator
MEPGTDGIGRERAEDRGRVLIVDDSRLARAVVARHLKSAGFFVQEADKGTTAMKILSGGGIDVLVMDLRLPELDGPLAPTRAGLSIEVTIVPDTPPHGMSSARALRMSAQDYLKTPSRTGDELILNVDRAVEERRRLSPGH